MSRPPIRLIDGLRAERDEAEMEAAILRAETLASARRMRFVVLTSVWEAARKPLLHELDRIERRLADPERVA